MTEHRVFVYGTLKSGYWNCERFLRSSELLGEAVTVKKFYVTDVGFPVAYRTSKERNALQVRGEVYAVSDEVLAALDGLEGVPYNYQRTRVHVIVTRSASSWHIVPWMYTRGLEPGETYRGRPCPVEDGCYDWGRTELRGASLSQL